MNTKLKFIVVGAVLLCAVGFLIFNSVSTSSEYYLTVGELRAKGAQMYHQKVRVAGIVYGPSIVKNAATGTLKFTAEDATGKLPVVYSGGAVPDIFGPGIQVVVEGSETPSGVFDATDLLAQCPSRYENAVKPPPAGAK
ncbi:MAG TPA: cytochrome c maturation protein CcmE [Chloroflexota bacterium]|nr:cytochrome c maturation protein CcmE [Chloroflexota bacterium]